MKDNPLVETVGLEELGGKNPSKTMAAKKGGKAASREKAAEKSGKSAVRRSRKVEGAPGKEQGSLKRKLVSPIALQKVLGNERFNREFRAAVQQDATPEDLTDEELMEFLCDALEQCFDHCREEEVEELEEIADLLGLKVTHEDPDVDLQKEREKVIRREMTREPGIH